MKKRIKKQPDVRKQELISAAIGLFQKKGYEKTSIQNIIDKVKVSKGAFYHYFASKEEILTAIAEMYTQQAVDIIAQNSKNKDLNALQKLNKLIVDMQTYKTENHHVKIKLGKVFQSQMRDPKFQQSMIAMSKRMIVPQMQKLFTQGVNEGIFKTDYPEELAEHYLEIMGAMKESITKPVLELPKKPENKKIIERKLMFFQDLLERLLGVKKGSINFAKPILNRYIKTR